eukprot:TRINITY_DN7399_c0_g2_i1.p1 TRINITY_DN7399_c0_g2~~TRINITY_DN7399_c0_g2_i1.p1  ORF type:complete len:823 (+),score=151.48 TRINITY_DN7399_c0_g2_i1:32-2500(+)
MLATEMAATAVAEITEGIHDEMMAAMSVHMRNAAAACAEVCAGRLRMLQASLSRSVEDVRRGQQLYGTSPPTTSLGATQQVLGAALAPSLADARRVSLVRQVRAKLSEQGETPANFFRARTVSAGQGLVVRDEFVACMASLNVGASPQDLLDLFSFAVGGTDRDTAVLEEVTAALDLHAPPQLSLATPGGSASSSLGAPSAMNPEAEKVVVRVRSAVGRSGRPFEEVFRGFCRSGGRGAQIMSRADLARVLSTFEPNMDPEIVARLWRLTVPEGAPGLEFSSFCTWFCPGGKALSTAASAAATPTGGVSEVQMLSDLLERSASMPRSPSGAGGPLSPLSSMPNLYIPENGPLSPTNRFSSTLMPEQLPVGGIGLVDDLRPRSCTWSGGDLATRPPTPSRPGTAGFGMPDDVPLNACLARLQSYLSAKGMTVNSAFCLYDSLMEQAVSQDGFVQAISSHGFALSKAEAEMIFSRLARRKADGKLVVFFEDVSSFVARLPTPLPQVEWGRDLIKQIDKKTREAGARLETLFQQLGADSVQALDVQAVLSRHSQLSATQWSSLVPLMDKKPDGTVPWQSLLKWAGLETGAAAVPAKAGTSPAPPAAPKPPGTAPVPPAAPKPASPAPPTAPGLPAAPAAPKPPGTAPLPPAPAAPKAPGASAVPVAPVAPGAPKAPLVPPAPGPPKAPTPLVKPLAPPSGTTVSGGLASRSVTPLSSSPSLSRPLSSPTPPAPAPPGARLPGAPAAPAPPGPPLPPGAASTLPPPLPPSVPGAPRPPSTVPAAVGPPPPGAPAAPRAPIAPGPPAAGPPAPPGGRPLPPPPAPGR